jgi:hypothetical protein
MHWFTDNNNIVTAVHHSFTLMDSWRHCNNGLGLCNFLIPAHKWVGRHFSAINVGLHTMDIIVVHDKSIQSSLCERITVMMKWKATCYCVASSVNGVSCRLYISEWVCSHMQRKASAHTPTHTHTHRQKDTHREILCSIRVLPYAAQA